MTQLQSQTINQRLDDNFFPNDNSEFDQRMRAHTSMVHSIGNNSNSSSPKQLRKKRNKSSQERIEAMQVLNMIHPSVTADKNKL